MASQDMIKAVKLSLRLTADIFDSEISMLIDSCTLDLKGAGVSISSTNSALITQAIVFIVKEISEMATKDLFDSTKN